LLWISV